MKTPARLLLSAAALAVLVWFLRPSGSTHEGATPALASPPARVEESDLPSANELESSSPPSDARESAAESSAPAPVATPPTGALRVHVRWPGNPDTGGTSVGELVVRVSSGALESPDLFPLEAVTDAEGSASFAAVPAGKALVTVDRLFGVVRAVAIVAGEEAELELELPSGFDIAGRVTDESERPVAGAEIWLAEFSDLANGALVAHSAADGTFHLRGLMHADIGARAPGYRPSKIAHFFGRGELRAHLVLRAGGGALDGLVTDWNGRPLAGAAVRVGPPGPSSRKGSQDLDEDWGTLRRAHEAGRFHADGLSPGPCPLLVRCAGFALFRGEVEIPAGGSASFTAVLAPEAALAGHVHDERGAPVSGALVRVGQEAGQGNPFRAAARTAADGSFRVGALEPGRPLEAWIEDAPGFARTEFQCEVGQTARWEAVLEALGEIRGRVVDERDAPLEGWVVELDDQGRGALVPDEAYALTELDGSFAFERVHQRAHRLSFRAMHSGFVSAHARADVFPGPAEVVLRVDDAMLPSARIGGAFLDEEGRPLPDAHVLPWTSRAAGSSFETCDPRTGRFELGPYAPGDMKLLFRAPGRGMLVRGPRLLAVHETWDVGEVRLQREGRLRVRLVAAGIEPAESIELSLDPFLDPFEGTGDERLSPPLAPRSYVRRVSGGELENLALPLEIERGAETVLEVPLRRGWRARVAVRAPESVFRGHLRVQLPSGPFESILRRREGEHFVAELRLAPGSHPVEATAGELSAAGTLVVEALDRAEPALVLALR